MGPRLAAFIAVVFWGLSFVATKAALLEISPIPLIFVRFLLGSVLLVGLVRIRGHRPLPPLECWPALALMGFVGVFVHQMLQAKGLTMTTAVKTGWLIGLVPIWSAILSAMLGKERFSLINLAGLIGGFVGALLVITQGRFGPEVLRGPSTIGDFLILLSTMNWAVYSVLGHRTIKQLGATRATSATMCFGCLMLLPFFLYQRGWNELPHLTFHGWSAILFLGIGCSALGYLFWYGALERIPVSQVAAFLYLEPLVTLIAAISMLGETITLAAVGGGLLVLLSVFVIQLPGRREQPAANPPHAALTQSEHDL